jgi:glycosyltransferase involved in cell wall biosynthesis
MMTPAAAQVSLIIPTACRPERVTVLRRALASVLRQDGVDAEIIIVVNGPGYDRHMLAELRAEPRYRVAYLPAPSLPAAHRHGRGMVSRPFFAFLDDDDELLPCALRTRLDLMLGDPQLDVVTTNGWTGPADDTPYIRRGLPVDEDPLEALLRGNWLGSCGALFRTATVPAEIFDGSTRYFEWTMVAFRLAVGGYRIRFLDVPTFRMHESPDSISLSDDYFRAQPDFLASLMPLLPAAYRPLLRRKYLAALHSAAERMVAAGLADAAWKYHVRSMAGAGGLKHAIYTPRLIPTTLRALAARFRLTGRRGGVREHDVAA